MLCCIFFALESRPLQVWIFLSHKLWRNHQTWERTWSDGLNMGTLSPTYSPWPTRKSHPLKQQSIFDILQTALLYVREQSLLLWSFYCYNWEKLLLRQAGHTRYIAFTRWFTICEISRVYLLYLVCTIRFYIA